MELLNSLAKEPLPGDDDLATALTLTRLVHEQYECEPYVCQEGYYSDYEVTALDEPLLSTSSAAVILGRTPQTVRKYYESGRLPGVRSGGTPGGRRASPIKVPQWAVVALYEHQSTARPREGQADETHRLRAQALEDAMIALRQAEEHARRARALAADSEREWESAHSLLADAVAQVLVPPTTVGLDR